MNTLFPNMTLVRSERVVVIRGIQGEQLAEVTEAGVHRVAPQAHDLRPWQGLGDETGVQEIVRQLVDETRRPPGIGAGDFEVTGAKLCPVDARRARAARSEEHPYELQSLMRIWCAVFRWKKKDIS